MHLNLKSEFLKDALTLITGTSISQAIPILITPVLTRLYLPEEYGLMGIYLGISLLLGILSTLSYQAAILLPENENEALSILQLCIISSFLVSVFSAIVILFLNHKVAGWMNAPELSTYLYLVPLSILSIGVNNAFTSWANRLNLYKSISMSKIISAVSTPFFSIILGLFINGPFGLFAGLIAGQLISPSILIIHAYKRNGVIFHLNSKSELIKSAKIYRDFPKYSLWADFINNFVNQLPIYMLSIYSGKNDVGHYNLSNRILGMPITLISTSIGQIFYQKASNDYIQKGNCEELYIKTFKFLFLLSVIPFSILIIFGPGIFGLFFGKEWREAGVYSQIMGLMFFFKFTVSPLSYMYYIANRQKEDLIIHIYLILSTAFCFYIGHILFHNVLVMLRLFTLNFSTVYLFYLFRTYRLSKRRN